jgi:aminopeptidase-like protein
MSVAASLETYFDRLWPICRSITGNGVRESLKILQEIIPLEIHEVPSGLQAFDWVVPNEWNIRDAYIITPQGKKIAAFSENNLHVVNYSIPVDQEMTWDELQPHVHTRPDLPDAIPYVTSYYKENWGFCITHREYETLPRDGKYRVVIDSSLDIGSLTYGDLILPGETSEEILCSTYICHPSMANNELSGPLVTAFLYQYLAALPKRRYTYRFVFVPETIGAIIYLNRHGFYLKENLHAGYVLTCVGDAGGYTYKHSKDDSHPVNQVVLNVLEASGEAYSHFPFEVGGSDERQYCSPGFNLPVGSLMRTMYHKFPEYHTSLDNKSVVSFAAMEETVLMYAKIFKALELNQCYRNTCPFGEPQLGKRGLYHSIGGLPIPPQRILQRLHLLSYADGKTDLLTIARKRGESVLEYEEVVEELSAAGLLVIDEKPQ